MKNLSEQVKRSCQHYVPELKVAMKPHQQNSLMFTNLKHKIPKTDKSGVVYKIDCKDCSATYIGETIQKLGERVKQHQQDCNKSINSNISALAKHSLSQQHNFNFDDVKILINERNKTKIDPCRTKGNATV